MRRAKFHRWAAHLPTKYTYDMDVWEGWTAMREMTYQEAVEAAGAELVACLGEEYAELRHLIVIN